MPAWLILFIAMHAGELAQAVFGVPNHSAVIQWHNLVNIAQQIAC
jgi:hypothetical protein